MPGFGWGAVDWRLGSQMQRYQACKLVIHDARLSQLAHLVERDFVDDALLVLAASGPREELALGACSLATHCWRWGGWKMMKVC